MDTKKDNYFIHSNLSMTIKTEFLTESSITFKMF